LKPSIECAYFDKKRKTQIILVPRYGGDPVKLDMEPGFVFHFANAYEDESGRIILDGPLYDRFPEFVPLAGFPQYDFTRFPKMLMTRFKIDPSEKIIQSSLLSEYPAELPKINPLKTTHRHRYIWSGATSNSWIGPFLSGVSKIDIESGRTLFRDFLPDLTSEPMFVPKPGSSVEDEGWVILPLYIADKHNSDLLVLDAADLSTVCRAKLPHHQPQGYHGSWVPAGK
ncbi:MAG: carotenoid oxygenase family protein, partial [Spirochaetes bacterium]|nr:carotenoid oxygenase family protein [Spirochaetota bacterium]